MKNSKSPHSGKPRRKSGLLRSQRVDSPRQVWTSTLAVVLALMLLGSCAPIAPRFRSGDTRSVSPSAGARPVTVKRDTSNVRGKDEEASVDGAENIASGGRSFKTEKNAAISNLDQAKIMREISKMMGVCTSSGEKMRMALIVPRTRCVSTRTQLARHCLEAAVSSSRWVSL